MTTENSNTMTPDELFLAKNITQIALANGAQAFSTMLKERVMLEDFSINPLNLFTGSSVENPQGKVHVMRTDFIGDILAKSYLILDEPNAQRVAQICLPPAYRKHQMMQEASLLEMDNIIAASVATKYADIIYTDVKGDVPHISYLEPEDVNARLQETIDRKASTFYYSVYFVSEKTNIRAEFICIFAHTFTENIKDLVYDKHIQTIVKSYADYTRKQVNLD